MNERNEPGTVERGIRVSTGIRIVRPVPQEPEPPEPAYRSWRAIVSQRAITALALDRMGRLWAGTTGGILLWDKSAGQSYLRFGPSHGLYGSIVSCLALDQNDLPWVGHAEGGLSRFDGQRWWPYTYLQQEPVRAIANAAQAGMWVATERAIYRIPPHQSEKPEEIITTAAKEGVDTQALLGDGSGVYLGNPWGIFRLSKGSSAQSIVEGLGFGCTSLARDTKGMVWAGTLQGVIRLDDPDHPYAPRRIPAGWRVQALAAGRNGIWVLSSGWPDNALAQVAAHADTWQWLDLPPAKLASAPIRTIAALPGEVGLWLGSDEQIMFVEASIGGPPFWSDPVLAQHQHDSLSNVARTAIGDQNSSNVWVGTSAELIELSPDGALLDTQQWGDVRALTHAIGPATPTSASTLWALIWPRVVVPIRPAGRAIDWGTEKGLLLAMAPDADGQLHVLTTHGLWNIADLAAPLVCHAPQHAVRTLVQTRIVACADTWWTATSRGLFRWRKNEADWILDGRQDSPGERFITGLLVHPTSGVLWVTTDMGLWSWNGKRWTSYVLPTNGPIKLPLLALAAADGDWLWLADDQGVITYNSLTGETKDRVTPFDSGLGSRRVVRLLQHAGYLWVVTQAGINRLQLQKGE